MMKRFSSFQMLVHLFRDKIISPTSHMKIALCWETMLHRVNVTQVTELCTCTKRIRQGLERDALGHAIDDLERGGRTRSRVWNCHCILCG